MTAVGLLTRRSTWGMDVDRTTPWTQQAVCLGRWDDYTEQLMPTSGVIPPTLARAAHNCRRHCPVLLQCLLAAETPGRRPLDMVQAGLWWPGYAHRPPRDLPDPGCGDHCAHLRRQR